MPGVDPTVLIALNRAAVAARLTSSVAHDVNNALQVISGTLELLEAQANPSPAFAKALETVRAQTARASDALVNVVTFTSDSVRNIGDVDMGEVARHSVALRAFAARRARLSLCVDPPSPGRLVVSGNRAQLQQAVLNLIWNAEQALAGTGGEIVVGARVANGTVHVRVSDAGPGIALDPPERALEAFTSTKDPWEAAGLGLWVAVTIAEAHGGSLVLARRSPGTAVELLLPVAPGG
jgi:signal transduction histidine kinase